MIRVTKLADYGIDLLAHCTAGSPGTVRTARGLAAATRIPLPTVAKVLKALAREGLLVSHRGVAGGYALARPPERISVAEVITALDGPIALTECLGAVSTCGHEGACSIRTNWDRINSVVRDALASLSIAEMARPPVAPPLRPAEVAGPEVAR